jgi:hypothetical protein
LIRQQLLARLLADDNMEVKWEEYVIPAKKTSISPTKDSKEKRSQEMEIERVENTANEVNKHNGHHNDNCFLVEFYSFL